MKLRVLETALYIEDLDKSEKFYRALFGCKTMLAYDRMRALNIGDTNVLLLFKRGGTTNGEEGEGGFIAPHDATGQIQLCFAIEKDDVEEYR